jgi:large subunit ribosomal protein L5e
VVRLTAHYVICQVVYSEIDGDKVLAAAYSSELKKYGLTVGLKNYAAAYATGLLVARRLLTKLGMADLYKGNEDPDGSVVKTEWTNETNGRARTYWVAEVADERKPFRCLLDVGIRTTTTGARVFGAMKGAADGGLDIPHNEKRFPGYDRDSKEYDPESLKERIYGRHVADYMEMMQEEDPEAFEKNFSAYAEAGVEPDALEDLYREVHEKIRADPSAAAKTAYKSPKEFTKPGKATLEQRRARVEEKKKARLAALQAGVSAGGDDEEDDE